MFVSEENIDGFLRTVLCPSSCTQSDLEAQTLIEVLDVSEDRSQIRLKVRSSWQQYVLLTDFCTSAREHQLD